MVLVNITLQVPEDNFKPVFSLLYSQQAVSGAEDDITFLLIISAD